MGRVFFNTRENIHSITADYTCIDSDSGKVFTLNSTSAVAVTLPTDANVTTGWTAKFVVETANNNAYTIKTGDIADSGGDDFVGGLAYLTTTAGFGHSIVCAAEDNTITLDANDASNGGGLVGSWVKVTKLASNEWMISGQLFVSDADGTGAASITNAD